MSIRLAASEDIPDAVAACIELPLLRRYQHTVTSLGIELRRGLERGESVLVSHDDGRVTGLAWFIKGGTLGMGSYLRLLVVAPGAQRRGIGTGLLAEYETSVAAHSTHAFLLVSDFNDDAQQFYRRRGYRELGRLPKLMLPDVDELVFWKAL